MSSLFKNIGKGIGYFFAFPGLIIAIALYAVFGLVVFIFQFFKLIFLFFTGRTLFSDLPEDIELKALKAQANESAEEEEKKEENPLSLYPSDSVVYGAGYSSPLFNKEEKKEVEAEPEVEKEIEEDAKPVVEPEPEEGEEY